MKDNEDDDVAGETGCGVLGGAKAEIDEGDEGTSENVGESAPGVNVFMSNTVKAEANEHVLLVFVVSLSLPFGESTIGSTDDCVRVRGGEGG